MDKDQVKGKMDDAAGRVKRQVGEWTDDSKLQAEGAAQQVKGKAENAWGKTKDAVRDASDKVQGKHPESEDETADQGNQDDQRRKGVA
jgi:uncharacterized protein YjbJ (UPF0337 family)